MTFVKKIAKPRRAAEDAHADELLGGQAVTVECDGPAAEEEDRHQAGS